MDKYQPVIGLEIHVELKTKSAMFCQCKINQWEAKPNSHVCPVCLGLPGALPVPNKKAIEWTIKIAKALNCHINQTTKFDRKHYSYPDLPKGYQISQYDEPIATKGWLKIKDQRLKIKDSSEDEKTFHIHRVHLEEDTGKLVHRGEDTLVDFNRSGTPLVEIVTEPDFDNAGDVKRFLEELHTIIRYLDVSDADMEKGSMRMEPNISLRKLPITNYQLPKNNQYSNFQLPNYKVEVKNINSFRYVKQAIEYEIERQKEILDSGKTPEQETRGFDEKKVITYSQRSKEEAHDYRYFPEPDIPPLTFSKEYIDSIIVPELPGEKLKRYIDGFKIKEQDAFTLTREKNISEFFEQVISKIKSQNSNPNLKSQNLKQAIVNIIINKKISTDLSVEEFVKKVQDMLLPKETDKGLLGEVIDKVLKENKGVVDQYKAGKQNAIMFLVGAVMREMKGKAEAKLVISKLKEHLK